MVELVDTTDLKSVDPKGRAGSSPAPGTKREIAAMRSPVFFGLVYNGVSGHKLAVWPSSRVPRIFSQETPIRFGVPRFKSQGFLQ